MTKMSSMNQFIYFKDYENSCKFFTELMGFEVVLDFGWSTVWKIADTTFIGGVDVTKREKHYWQAEKSGLISFNVPQVDDLKMWHQKLSDAGYQTSELKLAGQGSVVGLSGFFATGPEGWHLEFEHFSSPEFHSIFHPEQA